jgi:archaellum biogenesis protein FlaJ (TadC family)
MEAARAMLDETMVIWLMALSVFAFIATLISVPILLIVMPADYFVSRKRALTRFRLRHPVLRIGALVVKNAVGVVLIVGGLLMLVTPGQGLLSIAVGIVLVDFPGKRGLERRVIRRPRVHRAINWIRARAGREPIRIPGDDPA